MVRGLAEFSGGVRGSRRSVEPFAFETDLETAVSSLAGFRGNRRRLMGIEGCPPELSRCPHHPESDPGRRYDTSD